MNAFYAVLIISTMAAKTVQILHLSTHTDLYSFVEFNAEVLKDPETLIQLEGVLVFTKEIDESVALFSQFQPAPL